MLESNPHLYIEVLSFYAAQVRAVDAQNLEEFADTFTDDGSIEHDAGARIQGREAMLADMRRRLPAYAGIKTKHWFGQVLVTADDDQILTDYYACLTLVAPDGSVKVTGTYSVRDVLVSSGTGLRVRERLIRPDTDKGKVSEH